MMNAPAVPGLIVSWRGVVLAVWQCQAECRSRPRGALGRQLSTVSFHGGSADRKSHAHSAILRREECIEQARQIVGLDPGAVVLHRDGELVAAIGGGTQGDGMGALLARHGLAGIDQEIDKNLLKLDPVSPNRAQAVLGLGSENDIVLRKLVSDQEGRFLDDL